MLTLSEAQSPWDITQALIQDVQSLGEVKVVLKNTEYSRNKRKMM